ncbi:MAG: class I adenylate-forming enzyme family protein [Proteobacteria bacterium]|nr:class I adenylate-forming enzyme family protein [Pseudomonadota bacterium]
MTNRTEPGGNLGAIFAPHAEASRAAIIDLSDEDAPAEITYGALDDACNGVARALIAKNLGVGDRIGILGLNRHEYIAVMFGAMRAGIVPVPINIKLPAASVADIAHDAGVKLMFTAAAERLLCPADIPVVDFDTEDYAAFLDPGPFTPHEPADSDVAFQVYTSGSTGRPKGVLLSHKAHIWVSRSLAENRRIQPGHSLLIAAPLYHKNAMNIIKSGLCAGATIVMLPKFDAGLYIRAAARYRVKALSGVPTMYALMLREQALLSASDLSSVGLLTLGSAPTSDALYDALTEAFPQAEVRLSFGITESSPVMFGPHPDGLKAPRNSIGWALPDTEIILRDGATPDQGVLMVRTPGMMLGYHNMPDETARRLKDGWFDTGDILRRDREGWYFFVGRVDDMFLSGGNNIYPGEVESVLERHPGIYQAIVVAAPHSLKDQVPYAFVVPKPGAGLSEEMVKAYTLEHLPPSHHPRRVLFLDALPLAGTNKIDRRALAEKARLAAQGG